MAKKKQKLSPWFEHGNPVHSGVYERYILSLGLGMVPRERMFGYYDSVRKRWFNTSHTKKGALAAYKDGLLSGYQKTKTYVEWRGVLR